MVRLRRYQEGLELALKHYGIRTTLSNREGERIRKFEAARSEMEGQLVVVLESIHCADKDCISNTKKKVNGSMNSIPSGAQVTHL